MTQPSEERVSNELTSAPLSAQIVPFERPQSELQKAVQQRAQEAIDRERARAVQGRPPTWRRALVLALAAIPVFITFGAAIGFVGALRQFNTAIFESQEASPPSSAPQPQAPGPAPMTAAPMTSESGVVLLQPYSVPSSATNQGAGSTSERR